MRQITLIPLIGMEIVAYEIKEYLQIIAGDIICKILEIDLPRFTTGDAKAVLGDSVRGEDVFILTDVGNYGCTYRVFGVENNLSPDEHFQNLVRAISAIGGKASRINVVMPMLYAARQDRRTKRESLDCAVALQQLEKIGVQNIMTIDVHDDRVQNAIPFIGFDNLMPTYQMIKALCEQYADLQFDEQHMVMVSPDFGAMNRNFAFANELGLDLGVFYKRRNLHEIKNRKNEILTHKYIGPSVEGKDVFIVDDIIASGETLLDSVKTIKELGAKRIFIGASFAHFTNGIDKIEEAFRRGLFEAIFISNASYIREDVIQSKWYRKVNMTKYIAYYIYCVNAGVSISKILDPHIKIVELIENYKEKSKGINS